MRPGFIRLRPYRSSGTHLVSRNLRGSTTRATSPQTRTSFPDYQARFGFLGDTQDDIGPVLVSPTSTTTPAATGGRSSQSFTQILRTRCSHSLSALTHFGMRPRSTESSLPRIWRRCVLTCGQSCPIRPSFFSSSSLCRPSSPSLWLSTSPHHLHRSDHQGVPYPLLFLSCQ